MLPKLQKGEQSLNLAGKFGQLVSLYRHIIFHHCCTQGLVKGAILCFLNLYFYFQHGESTSTANQLTSPASQKSKDLNKVLLLL